MNHALELITKVVLGGFACYRAAQFVVYDDTPFELMFKLRLWAGVYDLGENGLPKTRLGKLLSCPHCVGLWIALVTAVTLFWSQPQAIPLAWWAIAGVQSYMEQRNHA